MPGDFKGPSPEEMGIGDDQNKKEFFVNFDKFNKISELDEEKFDKYYGGNGRFISAVDVRDYCPGAVNDILKVPVFSTQISKQLEDVSRILSSKNKEEEIIVVEGRTYAIDNKLIKSNEGRFRVAREAITLDGGLVLLGDHIANLKNELRYENEDKVDSIEFLGGDKFNLAKLKEILNDEEFRDKLSEFKEMIFAITVRQKKENKNVKNVQEENEGAK